MPGELKLLKNEGGQERADTESYDYFYVEAEEDFTFFRFPKLLISERRFKSLSTDAKVLYGLMVDRVGLSRENGWTDEAGHVFVYYSMETIMKALQCGKNKACKLLKELETYGLIERRKQGFCKPARIFVKDFTHSRKQKHPIMPDADEGVTKDGKRASLKQGTNNTEKNKTEVSETDPILSGRGVDNSVKDPDKDEDMDERDAYREYLHEQLGIPFLYETHPYDRDLIDAIQDLMLDTICSKRKKIRIAGDDKPAAVVKAQFQKLNSMHIEYVMDCMKKNCCTVRNIKQYMLASLYNAPLTMESYYQARVNSDMAERRALEAAL